MIVLVVVKAKILVLCFVGLEMEKYKHRKKTKILIGKVTLLFTKTTGTPLFYYFTLLSCCHSKNPPPKNIFLYLHTTLISYFQFFCFLFFCSIIAIIHHI